MKTATITLTRTYEKTVTIHVPDELIEGKTDDEIQDFLMEGGFEPNDIENHFYFTDLNETENSGEDDRYDIYEDDKQVHGGHL